MSERRPFVLVRDTDQWIRSSFDHAALDVQNGIVELAWATDAAPASGTAPTLGGGLAFDAECRLYHAVPDQDRVDRLLWAALDPTRPSDQQATPLTLLGTETATTASLSDFMSPAPPLSLTTPRGLAIDDDDRLFVAEWAGDDVLVFDLWSQRLLRRVSFPGSAPSDLGAKGETVYCVLSGTGHIVRFSVRSDPVRVDLPAGCTRPSRVAVSPTGVLAILDSAGTAGAHVWFVGAAQMQDFDEPFATDLEWECSENLVVAREPGEDFRRYQLRSGERAELPPLRAPRYDGLGIVRTPPVDRGDGTGARRIGYWSAQGFRHAVLARPRYASLGRVTTYRLDSGAFHTAWGRLYLDACIPPDTDIRVHWIVADEPDEIDTLLRTPPANVGAFVVRRPDLTPPMPPLALVPGAGEVVRLVHRRESGRELPWTQPAAGDPFATYEAPIDATPGRYLWVTLELRGNQKVTPKVRCLRAEHPSHDYLKRLPRVYSRDDAVASFLLRYLSLFEGFLGEIEARAVERDLLLAPCGAPDEVLPWLASFVGLVLDERWATAPRPDGTRVDARRGIIKEAASLFRFRGTLPGLQRFIELYLGVAVIILEHFRLRGLGGAVLGGAGDAGPAISNAVLGAGFRVGGDIGVQGGVALSGTVADAFRTHAHRFTIIVPAELTPEQIAVVCDLVTVHRPAHTLFDICTVGAGMRAGRGLHVGLSSIIGRTGSWRMLQLGATALGRGALVGRAGVAGTIGGSRLGRDSRAG